LTKALKLRCEISIQYENRVCYEITYENGKYIIFD